MLESNDRDFHDHAARIEQPALSNAEMQKIFTLVSKLDSAKPKRSDAPQTIFATLAMPSAGTRSRATANKTPSGDTYTNASLGFWKAWLIGPLTVKCRPKRSSSGY